MDAYNDPSISMQNPDNNPYLIEYENSDLQELSDELAMWRLKAENAIQAAKYWKNEYEKLKNNQDGNN